MKFPLDIKNPTIHTEFWTLASFHQGIANSVSWLQFSRDGTCDTWQAGMSSDNSYVIRASHATDVLTVNQNGDTPISGNLDVGQDQAQTSIKTYVNHIGKTCYVEMVARWASQGFIHFKTNHTTGELFFAVKDSLRGKIYMYCGTDIVYIYEDATIGGNLDVGPSQAQTSIKAYFNHAGSTGHIRIEGRYRDQGCLHFETNYQYGEMFLTVRKYIPY